MGTKPFCSLELSINCYNSPLTFQHRCALFCNSSKTQKVQLLLVAASTTVDHTAVLKLKEFGWHTPFGSRHAHMYLRCIKFLEIRRQQEALTSFPRSAHLLVLPGKKSEENPALSIYVFNSLILMNIPPQGRRAALSLWWFAGAWCEKDDGYPIHIRCLENVQRMTLNKIKSSEWWMTENGIRNRK